MKLTLTLLIAILLFSCSSMDQQQQTIADAIIDTSGTIKYDYTRRERKIGYNNERYLISTSPRFSHNSNEYEVEVMLRSRRDTVYTLTFDADTLLKLAKNHHILCGQVSIEELLDYKMVNIVPTNGIRGYKSYLIAKLSKEDSKDLYLQFAYGALKKNRSIRIMGIIDKNSLYLLALEGLENEKPLKIVPNDGIEFSYILGDTSPYEEKLVIDLTYKLTNNTDKDVEFITRSSSRLDWFLKPFPSNNTVIPFIMCNASWPRLQTIPARDSIISHTKISREFKSKPLERIGIDFRKVERQYGYKGFTLNYESIQSYYDSETDPANIIQATTNPE